MWRYAGGTLVPSWRRAVARAARGYNILLARPLTPESTPQHIHLKSSELLGVLKKTGNDVLKVQEQDVEDIKIMMSRLPESDSKLYEQLSESLLRTKFYQVDTQLLQVLLDLFDQRQEVSFLVSIVGQCFGPTEPQLTLAARGRLYDTWGLQSDLESQQKLLDTCTEPCSNAVTANLVIQTHLLRGEYVESVVVARRALRAKLALDRHTVELLVFQLLQARRLQDAFEVVFWANNNFPHRFLHRHLPLSNQQLGQLISGCVKENLYLPARTLINTFCLFQKLHYLDGGSLLTFARKIVRTGDVEEFGHIVHLFSQIDRDFLTTEMRKQLLLVYLEAKYNPRARNADAEPQSPGEQLDQFRDDIKSLGVFPGVVAADLPRCVAMIQEQYPLHDLARQIADIQLLLPSEPYTNSDRLCASLYLNILVAAMAESGKRQWILQLLEAVNTTFTTAHLVDDNTMFYVVRSYSKSTHQLTEKSARFIMTILSSKYNLSSKTYRLVLKLFKAHNLAQDQFIDPVTLLYHQSLDIATPHS